MDTQTLLLITSAAVGAGGAGWVGWWVRGRVHSHRLAVLDEQWTRKLKSYENETELALAQGTLEATRGRELAQQAEELQARIRQLEQRLHSNGDSEGDLELRTRELELLRAASESELEELRTRRDAALAERDREIERLTAWVTELTPLSDALKDSGLKLSDRDRELETLRGSERAGDTQRASLERDLERLRTELEHERDLARRTGAEATETGEHLREAEERCKALDEALTQAAERHVQLARERGALETGLEEARRENATLASQVEEIQRIGRKREQEFEKRGERSAREAGRRVENALEERDAAGTRNDELAEQLTSSEARNAEAAQAREQLAEELAQLRVELERTATEFAAERNRAAEESEVRVDSLERTGAQITGERDSLRDERDAARRELEEQGEQLATGALEREGLMASLEELRRDTTRRERDVTLHLQESSGAAARRMQTLEKERDQTGAERDALNAAKIALEERLTEGRSERAALAATVEELRSEVGRGERSQASLRTALERAAGEMDSQRGRTREADEQLNATRKKLKERERKLEIAARAAGRAQAHRERQEASLLDRKERVETLRTQLKELRDARRTLEVELRVARKAAGGKPAAKARGSKKSARAGTRGARKPAARKRGPIAKANAKKKKKKSKKDMGARTAPTKAAGGKPAAAKATSARTKKKRAAGREKAKLRTVTLRPAARTQGTDLTRIPHIGARMAERLRAAGIQSPADLATLDRPGVEALAKRLGVQAARIRREGWVAGAAKLA